MVPYPRHMFALLYFDCIELNSTQKIHVKYEVNSNKIVNMCFFNKKNWEKFIHPAIYNQVLFQNFHKKKPLYKLFLKSIQQSLVYSIT